MVLIFIYIITDLINYNSFKVINKNVHIVIIKNYIKNCAVSDFK